MTCLRHTRRRDHLIRPREDPMQSDLGPPHARHADDFAPWLEVQKLHKRLSRDITPNNMDPGFHQRANGGCAGPGQLFSGELEGTLAAVSLRDKKMVPPGPAAHFSAESQTDATRPRGRCDPWRLASSRRLKARPIRRRSHNWQLWRMSPSTRCSPGYRIF